MISEKVLLDAKFYDKLVGIFFTSENCSICDELFEKIRKLPISQKYYLFKVNANEYLQYTVRLTRGIIPSLSIIDLEGRMIAVIESIDIDYIQEKLREIYSKRDKLPGIEFPKPKSVEEINVAEFFDIVNFAMDGNPIDFRGIEFLLFYAKVHKDYERLLNIITPLDPIGKFLVNGKLETTLDETYTNILAIETIYNISDVKDKLLERIKDDGTVFRSSRKEVIGLLVDEAITGSALLSLYQRTFDDKYLNLSLKIYDWIIKNLESDIGFRDSPVNDPITKHEYFEPLANSEASIFFTKLWAITDDSKIREKAEKALKIAFTLGSDIRVLSRVAIAYIKLNELIKSKKEVKNDIRVEIVKDNGCKEDYKYKDSCYDSLDKIEFNLF
ncbi:hypothetical protein SJAV_05540 [Sulfurisphaera javensis]|uniref:Thioredoxin n=1 Tax=Sulfurisphaera javensis TaxID=2049879 RepID=A0AAT9GNY0_9CREN